MDITLKEINCLLKIIDSGSFSAAADELNLSQPTISNHIANLEKKLNITLLLRKRDGVRPSPAGEIVYRSGKTIETKLKNIKAAVANLKGLKCGELRIGGSTIPGTYILPEIIGKFTQAYPGINLKLFIKDTQEILSSLKKNNLDIGIVGYPPGASFDKKKICLDTIIVAVKNDHPWAAKKYISVNTLLSGSLIMREQGSATRKVFINKIREKSRKKPSFKFIVETSAAMKEAIKAGLGPGIISQIAVRKEIKEKSLSKVKIKGVSLERSFYMVLKKQPLQMPALTEFIKLVKQRKL